MSGEKRVRGFYFFAVFLLLAKDVLTEYLFTVERKIGESDIITFRQAIHAKSYLESGSFEDVDLKNRTWCKQAVVNGTDQKRYTIVPNSRLMTCYNEVQPQSNKGLYFRTKYK